VEVSFSSRACDTTFEVLHLYVLIEKLVEGASTYTTRDGNSYPLKVRHFDKNRIEVYYTITKGAVRREVKRIFPRRLAIDNRFVWILGLLRGEGLISNTARSSMYRFAVVNNDPFVIRTVMHVLRKSGLVDFRQIKRKFIRITYGFKIKKDALASYWAKQLGVPVEVIDVAKSPQQLKKAEHGSCTLIISDVLLRRVFDLLADCLSRTLFSEKRLNKI